MMWCMCYPAATAQSIPLDAAKHEDKMTADGFFAIESLRKGTPNGSLLYWD